MTFDIHDSADRYVALSAEEALAKVRALIEAGRDPYVYDRFGDPMGLADLEEAARNG
ncbi:MULTISPECIES: hypothetical protein [unclassified Sphingomonas]|uniref:hypothetical protein n=1 Tax=unclassified Sphingomonas TaxID=196159 RepID=UPI000AE4AF80|nr:MULTISPECIES: hypothetical protein [unclassified Sphingomonas]